jgi:hypothetical protein
MHDVRFDTFSKGKDTPADSILYTGPNGPARQEYWNYRSFLGKLNYNMSHTCPDISMVVHQCAQFCFSSKAIHDS